MKYQALHYIGTQPSGLYNLYRELVPGYKWSLRQVSLLVMARQCMGTIELG